MNNVLLLIWNVNISGFKILHLTFVMWKNCHAYVSWLYTVGADQQLQHVVCILFKQRFYRRVFMTAYRPFTCIENKYKNDQFKMVLIERKLYLYSGLLLIITIFFFQKSSCLYVCFYSYSARCDSSLNNDFALINIKLQAPMKVLLDFGHHLFNSVKRFHSSNKMKKYKGTK